MHFVGIFNKDGGSFRTMDVEAFADEARQIFGENGRTLECRIVAGRDLLRELERAASDERVDALLVGGGDGTVSAAAEVCFRTGTPLAVLPAGTMNLFARSLKLPHNLHDALAVLARGEVAPVDIATANGKSFVHQYSVGIHPRLVRMRESLTYRSRWGKILATLRAIGLAVSRPPVFEAEIVMPDQVMHRRASSISVSNNILGEGHIPHADELDRGVLGVYVVEPMGTLSMAKFAVKVVLGLWKGSPLVTEVAVQRVTLRFPHRKRSAQAVMDGELIPLARRVDIAVHSGALKVVRPRAELQEFALPERGTAGLQQ